MKWKMKCLALYALAYIPYSVQVHRWLQRKVTNRYLDDMSDDVLAVYSYHVQNFLKLPAPERSSALEFGAGRNLVTALLLSAAGAREVFAYDIARLATVEQINHVIRQLRARHVHRTHGDWLEIENIDADLRRYYRINYRSPGDARDTKLSTGSIDFVCSTSTLEHICRDDLVAILAECRRICSPTALMSFIIDYHDHYASADPAITRFNFYRYPQSTWVWFNPPNHFQNRMRHCDYEQIFESCGLAALEKRSIIPPHSERSLQDMPLSAEFSHYSLEDLAALNGFFLLQATGET